MDYKHGGITGFILLSTCLILCMNFGNAIQGSPGGCLPQTGHCYQLISSRSYWTNAINSATAYAWNGYQGHLAAIDRSETNSIIDRISGSHSVWVCGSDALVEGVWMWEYGPLSGREFYLNKGPNSKMFTSWRNAEPNDSGGVENYIYIPNGGLWKDLRSNYGLYYIVQYSGARVEQYSPTGDEYLWLLFDDPSNYMKDSSVRGSTTVEFTYPIFVQYGPNQWGRVLGIYERSTFLWWNDDGGIAQGSLMMWTYGAWLLWPPAGEPTSPSDVHTFVLSSSSRYLGILIRTGASWYFGQWEGSAKYCQSGGVDFDFASFMDESWHHVLMRSYNGATYGVNSPMRGTGADYFEVFVDGKKVCSFNWHVPDPPHYISGDSINFPIGIMDNFRVWTRFLADNEIIRVAGMDLPLYGLKGAYHNGKSLDNLVDTRFDPRIDVDFVPRSLYFDGINDWVFLPDGRYHSVQENGGGARAITVECWINVPPGQNGMIITYEASRYASGYHVPAFYVGGGGKLWGGMYTNSGLYMQVTSTTIVADGTWHHVACVHHATEGLEIFIDGISEGSISEEGMKVVNMIHNTLGGGYCGGWPGIDTCYFTGHMDEVRLWHKARNETEITNNMYTPLSPRTEKDLVNYLPMDQSSIANGVQDYTRHSDWLSTGNTSPMPSANYAPLTSGLGTRIPGLSNAQYSVEWTGTLYTPFSGTYQFRLTATDGFRLWFDGQLIIDSWEDQNSNSIEYTVGNVASEYYYPIIVQTYQDTTTFSGASIKLEWSHPSLCCGYEVIPDYFLYPRPHARVASNYEAWVYLSGVHISGNIRDAGDRTSSVIVTGELAPDQALCVFGASTANHGVAVEIFGLHGPRSLRMSNPSSDWKVSPVINWGTDLHDDFDDSGWANATSMALNQEHVVHYYNTADLHTSAHYLWSDSTANNAVLLRHRIRTAPDAPTNISAMTVSGKMRISWNVPSANGYDISEYSFFQCAKGGGESVTVCGEDIQVGLSTSYDVTLLACEKYHFKVRARNAIGWGPYSNPLLLAPNTPDPPNNLVATELFQLNFQISWSPSKDNGAPASMYHVYCCPDSVTWATACTGLVSISSATTSADILAPVKGFYSCRVSAENCVGESIPSVQVSPVVKECPAGFYCTDPFTAIECASGSYCPVGSSAEVDCPIGSVCTTPSTITTCTSGSYCPARSTVEADCPAGSVCSNPSSITSCAVGSYCPVRSTVEADCPVGSVCVNPSTIAVCGSGSYCPSRTTVEADCPAGSVCSDPTVLAGCISGSYCPARSTVQADCPAGSVCNSPSIVVPCTMGSYCPTRSTSETDCPAGSVCMNPSTITTCTTGSYCPARSSTETDCPAGSVCPNPAATVTCSLGSYCPARSTAETDCPGGFVCADTTMILTCPAGSYCPVRSTNPVLCSNGSFCSVGSTIQHDCPAGSVCTNPGTIATCAAGSYCPVRSTAEADCPVGAVCPDPSVMTVCTPGSYCPAGSSVENDCPTGSFCPDPSSSVPCSSGSYCPVRSTTEDDCPGGSVCTNPSTLTTCSLGSFCPVRSTTEDDCPPGFFCTTPSTSQICSSGSYCPAKSTSEASCPAGSFCADPSTISLCSVGSYCPAGSTSEINCPEGSVCPNPSNISVCSSGSFCPTGSTVEDVCPAGSFCLDSFDMFNCTSGSYCPAGSSAEHDCPAGSFCIDPSMIMNCTAGSYCPLRSTSPLSCKMGSYCPPGSSEEADCPAGSVCSDPSTSSKCSAGSHCSAGSTEQGECPAGSVCSDPSSMVQCTTGSYCPPGSSFEKDCPAGSVCVNPSVISNCTTGSHCPSGSIAESDCPAGSTCSDPSIIVKCAAGSYCPARSTLEEKCPAGSFCTDPSTLETCPKGFYCPSGVASPIRCQGREKCFEQGLSATQGSCDFPTWPNPKEKDCSYINLDNSLVEIVAIVMGCSLGAIVLFYARTMGFEPALTIILSVGDTATDVMYLSTTTFSNIVAFVFCIIFVVIVPLITFLAWLKKEGHLLPNVRNLYSQAICNNTEHDAEKSAMTISCYKFHYYPSRRCTDSIATFFAWIFFALWVLIGIIAFTARLMSVEKFFSFWLFWWCGKKTNSDAVVNSRSFNIMALTEVLFETLPQIILQSINNTLIGSWSAIAIVSTFFSAFFMIEYTGMVLYFKIRGISVLDIPLSNDEKDILLCKLQEEKAKKVRDLESGTGQNVSVSEERSEEEHNVDQTNQRDDSVELHGDSSRLSSERVQMIELAKIKNSD